MDTYVFSGFYSMFVVCDVSEEAAQKVAEHVNGGSVKLSATHKEGKKWIEWYEG